MKNFRRKGFLGVFIFLAVFAAAIAIVMLLWNALIPSIIGWTAINYWQAAGLMLLSRLLLGGFGHFGKFGRHHKSGRGKDFHYWHMMRGKMKGMSREEKREYMRRHMSFDTDAFCDNKTTQAENGTAEE
jgi:hypothetical protein